MNRKKSIAQRRNRVQREALYPPQLVLPINIGHTYRFLASSAVSRNLTIPEVLDLVCQAATATSAYRIMGAIRLKKIEIWACSTALDVPVTISFQKISTTTGLSGSSQLKADTSMGFDRPAHLSVKFKESEQVGQWQDSSVTGVYGGLTVPKGATIDITYTANVQDALTATAVAGAVAGATVGQVYLRALDNSNATPALLPVAYPTI